MTDFDRLFERRGTGSYKWDANGRVFGRDDLLPFWVADMDFATPAPVLEAIRKRSAHPVLGYEDRPAAYYDAVRRWLATRHGWDVPREWLMFCPPSSIVGMHGVIETMSERGESIAVPTPVYGPLTGLVEGNRRRLIRNPLREVDGRFVLDVDDLERRLAGDTRIVLLCSPHNPTGRVFRDGELQALLALARARNLVVISDEVHCDLVMPGQRHRPFGTLGHARSVTVISPNKTFNTAGLPQATLVMPDPDMRARFQDFLDVTQLNHDSTFAAVAMRAAYTHCADWVDEVVAYIAGNHRRVAEVLGNEVPAVRVTQAEATYLAWLDCRRLDVDDDELQRRLLEQRVALYRGTLFGEEGRGFLRMNIACPRAMLDTGLARVARALRGPRP